LGRYLKPVFRFESKWIDLFWTLIGNSLEQFTYIFSFQTFFVAKTLHYLMSPFKSLKALTVHFHQGEFLSPGIDITFRFLW